MFLIIYYYIHKYIFVDRKSDALSVAGDTTAEVAAVESTRSTASNSPDSTSSSTSSPHTASTPKSTSSSTPPKSNKRKRKLTKKTDEDISTNAKKHDASKSTRPAVEDDDNDIE
jgi:hypothetical protein